MFAREIRHRFSIAFRFAFDRRTYTGVVSPDFPAAPTNFLCFSVVVPVRFSFALKFFSPTSTLPVTLISLPFFFFANSNEKKCSAAGQEATTQTRATLIHFFFFSPEGKFMTKSSESPFSHSTQPSRPGCVSECTQRWPQLPPTHASTIIDSRVAVHIMRKEL